MDTAGYCTVAALLVFASLLWQLNVDFYRPWCERRVARLAAERREHDAWLAELRRMNDELSRRMIPAMRALHDSAISAAEASRNLQRAMEMMNNAARGE